MWVLQHTDGGKHHESQVPVLSLSWDFSTAAEPKHCQAPYMPYAKLEGAIWGIAKQVLEPVE